MPHMLWWNLDRRFGDRPFDEVPEQFAYDEGEGDRSLAYWREAHRNYFSRQRFKDRAFDEQMPLVCEQFRVVHVPAF